LLLALEREPDPPTTARRPEQALDAHLADSLSGLEFEQLGQARRIADIGSGAGFPGLALAAALPEARVDMIDSQSRKTAVSDRLLQAASLGNARSITARAEDWARVPPPLGGREAYDAVTARALAPLDVLAEYASPLLAEGGVLVAWKGARDEHEERAAEAAAERLGMQVVEVRRVQPFEAARNRHLHLLRKAGPTPEELPRRAGMARKRPPGGGGDGSPPNKGESDRERG
jgi:16S rRNA (guanine527-N7)-methyltransferase